MIMAILPILALPDRTDEYSKIEKDAAIADAQNVDQFDIQHSLEWPH
jgi:hypothetical protein